MKRETGLKDSGFFSSVPSFAGIDMDTMRAADSGCLDIDRLRIAVHQGEVWLKGEVEDKRERMLVEGLVKGIAAAGCCHALLKINQRACNSWQD